MAKISRQVETNKQTLLKGTITSLAHVNESLHYTYSLSGEGGAYET